MAALQGTILASKIVPTDSLDTYATHDDKYGRGGHRSVDTIVERDEITTPRRKEGMTVYVKENKTKYILENGIENVNWKVDSSGGGSGGDVDLSDYYKKTETYNKAEVDTKIAEIPSADLTNYYNKTEVDNKIADIPETDLSNYYNKTETYSKVETDSLLDTKQDNLVSGTSIKTINGQSVLGNGGIDLEGLSTLSHPKLNVEVLTERRHVTNGKPIYVKTIDFGALPNNTTKAVPHDISNVEWINIEEDSSYVVVSNNPIDVRPISFPSTSGLANVWRAHVTRTVIEIGTGLDRSSWTGIVTVQYTKTTDTAESPVKLVGSKDLFDTMKDNGFGGSYEDFLIEMKGPDGNSIVATDMLKLESSIEVTVGGGGDCPTINAALEFLSKNYYPVYKLHGITATIRILTGFVMQEQVFVRGINLSWITIVSDDESILVDNTSLVMDFSSSDYGIVAMPLFGISKGGCGPRINSKFTFDVLKPTGNKHGLMTIGAGSSAEILSGKGFIGAGNCGIYAELGSTILANGAVINNSRVSGAYAANNSSIIANSANADDCGENGIYALNGSVITASSIIANNAGSRAINSLNNSRIHANSASVTNAGNIAISATNCSVVSAISVNATGSKNDGVYAIQGSEISIAGGKVNSFTRYGVIANQFSRINATNVIIQNQTVGNHRFAVFLGSTILANGINVTGGTVATFNQAVNTLTSNGIIYQ